MIKEKFVHAVFVAAVEHDFNVKSLKDLACTFLLILKNWIAHLQVTNYCMWSLDVLYFSFKWARAMSFVMMYHVYWIFRCWMSAFHYCKDFHLSTWRRHTNLSNTIWTMLHSCAIHTKHIITKRMKDHI